MSLLIDHRARFAPALWAALLCTCFVVSTAWAQQSGSGAALRAAASSGDVDAVNALLAEGVAVDDANDYGATALMMAAMQGREDVVEALLEAGADAALEDSFYGRSPMAWATWVRPRRNHLPPDDLRRRRLRRLFLQTVEAGDVNAVNTLLETQVPEAEVMTEALKIAIATRTSPSGGC